MRSEITMEMGLTRDQLFFRPKASGVNLADVSDPEKLRADIEEAEQEETGLEMQTLEETVGEAETSWPEGPAPGRLAATWSCHLSTTASVLIG
jgi:hypothetical protein